MNLTKPNWDFYYGNNHHKIELPEIYSCGSFSFKEHLNKPLSDQLWEDLIHRLMINGLCIYRYYDAEWTVGWPDGHCVIRLDQKNNVLDIIFSPYKGILYTRKGSSVENVSASS